jgi:predicted nucleotidyltransferase
VPGEPAITPPGAESAGTAWPDQALLDEVIRRVVEVARPDRIILFGSAARGQAGPDRDLDLLVIKRDVSHRGRLAQDIHLNFFGLGVAIDVIVATPEDVERFGHKIGSILRPALREGRVIYAA